MIRQVMPILAVSRRAKDGSSPIDRRFLSVPCRVFGLVARGRQSWREAGTTLQTQGSTGWSTPWYVMYRVRQCHGSLDTIRAMQGPDWITAQPPRWTSSPRLVFRTAASSPSRSPGFPLQRPRAHRIRLQSERRLTFSKSASGRQSFTKSVTFTREGSLAI